jgi:hypothetical protein
VAVSLVEFVRAGLIQNKPAMRRTDAHTMGGTQHAGGRPSASDTLMVNEDGE